MIKSENDLGYWLHRYMPRIKLFVFFFMTGRRNTFFNADFFLLKKKTICY